MRDKIRSHRASDLSKEWTVVGEWTVYAHVLKTPGALTLINRTAVQLRALADEVPVSPSGPPGPPHGGVPGRPS
ncbi:MULTISPECIES: hypothetical protein [unclassified Streptomyces]|uniref:hypothetical protein n=1 Tax=unclassified Streptomyces TaxID=2593676 RepID=UPI0035DCD357